MDNVIQLRNRHLNDRIREHLPQPTTGVEAALNNLCAILQSPETAPLRKYICDRVHSTVINNEALCALSDEYEITIDRAYIGCIFTCDTDNIIDDSEGGQHIFDQVYQLIGLEFRDLLECLYNPVGLLKHNSND